MRKRKVKEIVTWNVPDHIRRLFEQLSKELRMTIHEVNVVVNAMVNAKIDPAPGDRPFTFEREALDELSPRHTWLGPVPPPDAEVDLMEAKTAYDRYCRLCLMIADGKKPSLEELMAVHRNQKDWCCFWRVRWPNAEGRKWFQWSLNMIRPDEERIRASAARQLKRAGIDVSSTVN